MRPATVKLICRGSNLIDYRITPGGGEPSDMVSTDGRFDLVEALKANYIFLDGEEDRMREALRVRTPITSIKVEIRGSMADDEYAAE